MKLKPKTIFYATAVIIVLMIAGYFFFFYEARTNITKVYAIDDGEKVKQTDLKYPLEDKNGVWDGSKVSLAGMKNEIVAFQIIIESENASAVNVDVDFDSLSNGADVIKNSDVSKGDPYDYRGKNIELFKEQYVHILNSSYPKVSNYIDGKSYVGYVPDALIPFDIAKNKGGAPFDISAGKNQGVWIDIYIPKTAISSVYKGEVVVKENYREVKRIPVELKVYNAVMPDENHFKNMFIASTPELELKHNAVFRRPSTPGSQAFEGDLIEERYFQMFHRHRINLNMNTQLDGMDKYYGKFITGKDYDVENKYDGPGKNTYQNMYSVGTYDMPFYACYNSGFCGNASPSQEYWKAADSWTNWFNANSPNTEYFKYMLDEPDWGINGNGIRVDNMTKNVTWNYEYVAKVATMLKTNPGIGKDMKIFVTTKVDYRLKGLIDIWSVAGKTGIVNTYGPDPQGYLVQLSRERRAYGEEIGIYNDGRPSYPAVQYIDTDATDPTAMMWLSYKYNVDHYFLWETTGTWRLGMGEPDVFNIAIWNGNGDFIYPGEQKSFGATANNKGLKGPIASIRMKAFRRGMQDYEYLWLAKQKNIDTTAIVNNIVPHAFDDYGDSYINQNSKAAWASRGSDYQSARIQILEKLK